MPGQGRQGCTKSLACTPSDFRSFHFYRDARGASVYAEIVDAAYGGARTSMAATGVIGDVLGRMRAAARGRLRGAEELVAVRNDPLLWEIRWNLRKIGQFRMYHAEPGSDPDMVALRFHEKHVGTTDDETTDRQDSEIALAGQRCRSGEARWGHLDPCQDCLSP